MTCKLLHLRSKDSLERTYCDFHVIREEIGAFADLVFELEGFLELRCLANGDFVFRDSCEKCNLLYCCDDSAGEGGGEEENESNYKVLKPSSNEELWEWVQSNMETLAACPYDSLLRV